MFALLFPNYGVIKHKGTKRWGPFARSQQCSFSSCLPFYFISTKRHSFCKSALWSQLLNTGVKKINLHSNMFEFYFFFNHYLKNGYCKHPYSYLVNDPQTSTNNSLPGYFGIMATRHVQFCCIFAVTKDKFDYF